MQLGLQGGKICKNMFLLFPSKLVLHNLRWHPTSVARLQQQRDVFQKLPRPRKDVAELPYIGVNICISDTLIQDYQFNKTTPKVSATSVTSTASRQILAL